MSRQFALGLAALAAIGTSLAMVAPANAGGSSGGSFGGFFGGSHGSSGGSFGGLFHHHNGSSGGGYGSNSDNGCDCGCGGSEEAKDADHRDNHEPNRVSERDDRVMEAPSRDVRESRDVNVYERNRNGRRYESRVIHESSKDDKNAEHKDDSDRKKTDKMKKGENKDRDKDKDKEKKEKST
jgi:hypothetical protein